MWLDIRVSAIMKGNILYTLLLCCFWALPTATQDLPHADHRYPDYIINDPRVSCSEEGSFHHPANCSWFYRCVDWSDTGYFHFFFFECEPGTVFVDELDQCVWGTVTTPPCTPGAITPPVPTSPNLTTSITPTGEPSPPSSPSPTSTSSNTMTFTSTSTPSTTATSSTTTPTTTTSTSTTTPSTTTTTSTTTPTTTTSTSTTTQSTTTTTTTSTTPAPLQGSQSRTECIDCTDRAICENGKSRNVTKICRACSLNGGEYQEAAQLCNRWIPNPLLNQNGGCLSGEDLCRFARQDDDNQIYEHFASQCSFSKSRPDDPEIRRRYCRNFHYCSPFGIYLKTSTLCGSFFQCLQTRDAGWSTEIRNCGEDYLYNFELDQCMPQPKAFELCSAK